MIYIIFSGWLIISAKAWLIANRRFPPPLAAIAELVGLRKAYVGVFDDNDVVDLLRIAVEREGGQGAFSRHSGVQRAYLSRVLNGKEPPGRSIAKSLRLRKVYIVK